MLDIIADTTVKGSVSAEPSPVAPHQTIIKFPAVTPKKSSKCKKATSRGATAPEKPMLALSTNPTLSKKKKQPAVPPQGSPKDDLRSSTKKKWTFQLMLQQLISQQGSTHASPI